MGNGKRGFVVCSSVKRPAAAVSRDCWLGRSSQHGAPPGVVGVVCIMGRFLFFLPLFSLFSSFSIFSLANA